jgi:hypothetical protein
MKVHGSGISLVTKVAGRSGISGSIPFKSEQFFYPAVWADSAYFLMGNGGSFPDSIAAEARSWPLTLKTNR